MFVQDELLTIKDYFVSVDDETLTLNGDDSFTVKDLIGGFELNLPVGETIHISFDLVLKSTWIWKQSISLETLRK